MTGSAIAHALLRYARALSLNGASDTVAIPVIADNGEPTRAEFLIGPASQLVTETVDTHRAEIIDEVLVARLDHLARALGPSRPMPILPDDEVHFSDFDDL